MSLSYCVLHKECNGCAEGIRYTVRFYDKPVDTEAPFHTLPSFIGCCNLLVNAAEVHVTCMVMMEVEIEGKKYGFPFEKKHRLDLWRELVKAEPDVVTAHYERHRPSSTLTTTTLSIPHQLRYLTRST